MPGAAPLMPDCGHVGSSSAGPWDGPCVCQQTILSFCLLADTRRLYGFRHDSKTFFAIIDQREENDRVLVRRTFRPRPQRGGVQWLSSTESTSPARTACWLLCRGTNTAA